MENIKNLKEAIEITDDHFRGSSDVGDLYSTEKDILRVLKMVLHQWVQIEQRKIGE